MLDLVFWSSVWAPVLWLLLPADYCPTTPRDFKVWEGSGLWVGPLRLRRFYLTRNTGWILESSRLLAAGTHPDSCDRTVSCLGAGCCAGSHRLS